MKPVKCPKCKGRALEVVGVNGINGVPGKWGVECWICFHEGPKQETKTEAVAAWNRAAVEEVKT